MLALFLNVGGEFFDETERSVGDGAGGIICIVPTHAFFEAA